MRPVLRSIIRKEFIHIWRDPQTLLIVFLMPVIMLFLFGYAITMEMRNIPTLICDYSRSVQSRTVIRAIASSNFFRITERLVREREIDGLFQKKTVRCIVVFPADFARHTALNAETNLQVLIDASDPNAANFINNYLTSIVSGLNLKQNRRIPAAFSIEPRFLYNTDLRSANFFVPGLVALIVIMVSALLTSIAIAREKELGTMEQILVSPISGMEIIIGKVIPYLVIAFVNSLLILAMSSFVFHVPFQGSLVAVLFSILVYIFTGLSFGLLISTIAKTQQVAMIMTLMITMLPTIMLSGFMFPIDSMPAPFRAIALIVPPRHFLEILRGIMLKGIPIALVWDHLLFLILLSVLLIVVSVKKFKYTLE